MRTLVFILSILLLYGCIQETTTDDPLIEIIPAEESVFTTTLEGTYDGPEVSETPVFWFPQVPGNIFALEFTKSPKTRSLKLPVYCSPTVEDSLCLMYILSPSPVYIRLLSMPDLDPLPNFLGTWTPVKATRDDLPEAWKPELLESGYVRVLPNSTEGPGYTIIKIPII